MYVLGRADETVILAGENVSLLTLDDALTSTGAARAGRAFCAWDQEIGLVVGAEMHSTSAAPSVVAHVLSRAIVERCGHRPAVVAIVERGTLPLTTSGKPRRQKLVEAVADQTLSVIHSIGY